MLGYRSDLDGSNIVNLTDITIFSPYFGLLTGGTFVIGDLEGDGDFDFNDFFMLSAFGMQDLDWVA